MDPRRQTISDLQTVEDLLDLLEQARRRSSEFERLWESRDFYEVRDAVDRAQSALPRLRRAITSGPA